MLEPSQNSASPESRRAVLIVDDHSLLRVGVRATCQSLGIEDLDFYEAGSLADALALYRQYRSVIRLVVLDLNLPDSKGLKALREIKQEFREARVIVLTGSTDEAIASEARQLGADQFVNKSSSASLFAKVLLSGLGGARDSQSQGSWRPEQKPSSSNRRMTLSPRELEILELVLQGLTNQEIVDITKLKMGTVKNYVSSLLVVFGVPSRSRLLSLFS